MSEIKTTLTELFSENYGLVISLARRYAPNESLANDIVQQAFIEFVGSDNHWNLEADIRPLLHQITKNVALRHWHEKQRLSPEKIRAIGEYFAQRTQENTADDDYFETSLELLRLCLEKLPYKSRQLIDMRYFNRVRTEDIAKEYHSKPKTISRAICRIREVLKKCIQQNRKLDR
ncbi:MAG: sigma-70 family RNA polymerase sigma factor [Thermoguttaceae bacterium]